MRISDWSSDVCSSDPGCGLIQLPDELHAHASTLTLLNLGNNRLSSLPEWLADFSELRVLFFANHDFPEVPAVLGKLPSLYMSTEERRGWKACVSTCRSRCWPYH